MTPETQTAETYFREATSMVTAILNGDTQAAVALSETFRDPATTAVVTAQLVADIVKVVADTHGNVGKDAWSRWLIHNQLRHLNEELDD